MTFEEDPYRTAEGAHAFHLALAAGISPALSGAIVTFDIIPHRAETGYGYIQDDQKTKNITYASFFCALGGLTSDRIYKINRISKEMIVKTLSILTEKVECAPCANKAGYD